MRPDLHPKRFRPLTPLLLIAALACTAPRAIPIEPPRSTAGSPSRPGAVPVDPSSPGRATPTASTVPAIHAPAWTDALTTAAGSGASIAVVVDGVQIYGHLAKEPRAPASNEKLLLSMAILDRMGPGARFPTEAVAAGAVRHGVLHGDLWLVGHGDPLLDTTGLTRLAARLRARGITRVQGAVMGDTSGFRRDRWAFGWRPIALQFISVPTALAYQENEDASGFVFDPERRAAGAFRDALGRTGIAVQGGAGAGAVPTHLTPLAHIGSAPLGALLHVQNVNSDNLIAETLSKALGAAEGADPSSIPAGAAAIRRWAASWGADVRAFDASGLSYRNRVSALTMASLLDRALGTPWGPTLLRSLATPGEGTLSGRLAGVPVHAKTGTLILAVSALSGYVRLRDGRLAAFSVLCHGISLAGAHGIQDAVARALAAAPALPRRAAA